MSYDGDDSITPGAEFGPSSWIEVPQEKIDAFAEATGDHQWIHVDPERAAAGPFGTTIGHGYLTLSLLPVMSYEVVPRQEGGMAVNYGLNRVRFPAPVPVGLARARHVPRRDRRRGRLGLPGDDDRHGRARGRRQARLRRRGRVPLLPVAVLGSRTTEILDRRSAAVGLLRGVNASSRIRNEGETIGGGDDTRHSDPGRGRPARGALARRPPLGGHRAHVRRHRGRAPARLGRARETLARLGAERLWGLLHGRSRCARSERSPAARRCRW